MPTNTHDDQRPPRIKPRDGVTNIHALPTPHETGDVVARHAAQESCPYCLGTGIIDDEDCDMEEKGCAGGMTIKCHYCRPARKEK